MPPGLAREPSREGLGRAGPGRAGAGQLTPYLSLKLKYRLLACLLAALAPPFPSLPFFSFFILFCLRAQHAPSYVVSALIKDAYDDGCEYFYQINDDTNINSPDWASTFTGILLANPLGSNVGVTGPTDTNNRRILTHAFVHRYIYIHAYV